MYRKLKKIIPFSDLVIAKLLVLKGMQFTGRFKRHFSPMVADCGNNSSHKIRHQVYCVEEGFEPQNEAGQEVDKFDSFSYHCLLRHHTKREYAGTVRVVAPTMEGQVLPIVAHCSYALTDSNFHPDNFPLNEVCEISRLAVPRAYRKRKGDKYYGAATGNLVGENGLKVDQRNFPAIAISLYLAAASLALRTGHKHCFVMMEPSLAKRMARVGICFKQIGETIEYHGVRAPYYISAEMFIENIPPVLRALFRFIDSTMCMALISKASKERNQAIVA